MTGPFSRNPDDAAAPDLLRGSVAIVAGARYGLGRSIASELGRHGAAVMLGDFDPAVEQTALELRADGINATAFCCDVTQPDTVRDMVKATVATFGRLDIMVANAAMARRGIPLLELTPDIWDATMATNLRGALTCIQAAARQMIEQGEGGRIITIGSTAGLKPYRRRAHYGASKAALIQLSKIAGLELAEHDITVNCVCPGQTRTENLDVMMGTAGNPAEAEEMKRRQAAIPLGPNDPIDIASAVVFLASLAARKITGQVLAVDGGGLMT